MSQLTRLETMNTLLYGNLSEAVIGLCCRYLGSFQFTGFVHLSIFLTSDISEENVTSIFPVSWGNHSEWGLLDVIFLVSSGHFFSEITQNGFSLERNLTPMIALVRVYINALSTCNNFLWLLRFCKSTSQVSTFGVLAHVQQKSSILLLKRLVTIILY